MGKMPILWIAHVEFFLEICIELNPSFNESRLGAYNVYLV